MDLVGELNNLFYNIAEIFKSKDRVKVCKMICENPNLPDEKVKAIADIMK